MNKIINSCYIKSVLILFFLTSLLNNYEQDTVLNKYGLWVIHNDTAYRESVKKDAKKELLD